MPTERFFRLPQEKKGAIRKAAFREFSRVPLENVSINKIIQDAEISRGSFYTYFEDKRDVMYYLVDQLGNEMKGYALECFQKNKGNIFETYQSILEYIIRKCMEQDSDQLLQNILSIMGDVNFLIGGRSMAERVEDGVEEYMRQKCQDMDSLRTEEKVKEYRAVNQMLQALVCQGAGLYFMKMKSKEEVLQDFQLKADIVRRGLQW